MDENSIENITTDTTVQSNGYQVLVTGLSWNPKSMRAFKSKYDSKKALPETLAFDIPVTMLNQAKKNLNTFNDTIETYIYNTLSKKFGHEIYHCQIWLPLDK